MTNVRGLLQFEGGAHEANEKRSALETPSKESRDQVASSKRKYIMKRFQNNQVIRKTVGTFYGLL